MKIENKDLKKAQVCVTITTLDDLWVLSKVIEQTDVLIGSTQRKLKIGDAATDRNVKVIKKWMTLAVAVEKLEYEPELKVLRATGPIQEGNDDVAKGDYHSFTLEIGNKITIQKKQWFSYQLERLTQAEKQTQSEVMLVVCDREQALIGWLSAQGFNHISSFKGDVSKKYDGASANENFFSNLLTQIKSYKPKLVICGTSHFWQKELTKNYELLDKPFKFSFLQADDVSFAGVKQMLAAPEFNALLQDNVYAKQSQLFTQILSVLGEKGAYGLEQLTKASEVGAVADLLITNEAIAKAKEKDTYESLETILNLVEAAQGIVHLIDDESPIFDQVKGLGGMVALLRFTA